MGPGGKSALFTAMVLNAANGFHTMAVALTGWGFAGGLAVTTLSLFCIGLLIFTREG